MVALVTPGWRAASLDDYQSSHTSAYLAGVQFLTRRMPLSRGEYEVARIVRDADVDHVAPSSEVALHLQK